MRLKSKLLSLNADKAIKTKIFTPANTEELRIPFKADKTAKVVGRLAQIPAPQSFDPDDAKLVTGVLVQNDFKLSLMAAEDLREYAGLTTTTIMCKQRLTLSAAGIDLIKWALESTFGSIEEIGPNAKSKTNGTVNCNDNMHEYEPGDEELMRQPGSFSYLIMGCIIVRYQRGGDVIVEWEGNIVNDGIADAVMAVLFTVESSPASVKRKNGTLSKWYQCPNFYLESSRNHSHNHDHSTQNPHANISPEERFSRLCMFLEAQFGPSITPITKPKLFSKSPKPKPLGNIDGIKPESLDGDGDDDEYEPEDQADFEAEELERLHSIGIPVPGVEIKVDKHIAKVWLETLEVECSYAVLRDRVRAVVERAVETLAPLWAQQRRR